MSSTFQSHISDHFPPFICIPVVCDDKYVHISFRDHSRESLQLIRDGICNYCQNFDAITVECSFDDKFNRFSEELFKIYNRCCPVRRKQMSVKRFLKPWLSNDVMIVIKRKHYLFGEYRRGNVTFEIYNGVNLRLSRLLKSTTKQYFQDKCNSYSRDIKKPWKLLRQLMGENGGRDCNIVLSEGDLTISDRKDISNILNGYFNSIGGLLNSQIPVSHLTLSTRS